MRVDEPGDHQHAARIDDARAPCSAACSNSFAAAIAGCLDRNNAVALDDHIANGRPMNIARPVIDTAAAD